MKMNKTKNSIRINVTKEKRGVFIVKNNKTIKNYLYDNAGSHYFRKNNISNYALEINKFSNIFNLRAPKEKFNYDDLLTNGIKKNIELIKKYLNATGYVIKTFSAEVSNKLVIGLGGASVYENDITLHHTYGIPYIPGQALKGVLRNYMINKYVEDIHNLNKKANLFITDIFGGDSSEEMSSKGKIIFLDSYPEGAFKIDVDVMTPHHKNYYTDNVDSFARDDDGVIPIKFWVADGKEDEELKFTFNVAIDQKLIQDYKDEKNIEAIIKEDLKEALYYIGIGAKTALGYGHFTNFKELK